MEKTFRIFGKQIELKGGNTFISYSYTKDGKKFLNVKFTRKCNSIPSQAGYLLITADTKFMSIEKGGKKDNKVFNDTLWIEKVIKVEKDEEYTEKIREQHIKEIEELLD